VVIAFRRLAGFQVGTQCSFDGREVGAGLSIGAAYVSDSF